MKTLSSTIFLALLSAVSSFSGGAGRCVIGEASPSHPAPPVGEGGSLTAGGYTITIDGVALAEGDTAMVVVDTPFEIAITGLTAFRGFLLMLANLPDATLEGPDDLSQPGFTSGCDASATLTHTSNAELSEIVATAQVNEETDTTMELNIVVQNSGGLSLFYYSQIPLSVVPALAEPPSAAPAEETDAPETGAPETDAPETDAPETDAPETDAPETDAPETDAPETEPPTEAPPTLIDLGNKRPEGIRLLPASAVEALGLEGNYAIVSELLYGGVLLVSLDSGDVSNIVNSTGFAMRGGIGINYYPEDDLIIMAGGGPIAGTLMPEVNFFESTTGDLVLTCAVPEDAGGPGGFLNEVAVANGVAHVTDSFRNRVWKFDLAEVVEGNCVVTGLELLPPDAFTSPGEFYLNGIAPYDSGFVVVIATTGALYYYEDDNSSNTTEPIEVLAPGSVVFADGVEVYVEADGSAKVYVTQNALQQISVYELQRPEGSPAPEATFLGLLQSDDYDDPTVSVVSGDQLYSVNARFTSISLPAAGEEDLETFEEVFTMVAVDRFNYSLPEMTMMPATPETSMPMTSVPDMTDAPTASPSEAMEPSTSAAHQRRFSVGIVLLCSMLWLY